MNPYQSPPIKSDPPPQVRRGFPYLWLFAGIGTGGAIGIAFFIGLQMAVPYYPFFFDEWLKVLLEFAVFVFFGTIAGAMAGLSAWVIAHLLGLS